MRSNYRTFYLGSLLFLLTASAYPIYMGVRTLSLYLQNGVIGIADYPKYIIPYTPMCIGILLVAALYPILYRLSRQYVLLSGSIMGTAAFIALETGFEQIKVIEGYQTLPLQSFQYSLCIATPAVLKAIGEPIYAANHPAFKVHFYLIAMIIILTVVGLIDGYAKMIKEKRPDRKKPLIAQTLSVAIFIGLCILACFTAFYRNGTINISATSAVLMSCFFIMFGVTFGTYIGSLLYGKKPLLAVVVPSLAALATTTAMFVGELVLMDGQLFRFGRNLLFQPIGSQPLATVDFLVILLAGAATYLLMTGLNKSRNCLQAP